MIAKIEIKTQYGKSGTTGINLTSELNEEPITVYAHSVQDGLDWIKSFPLYEGAIIDDLSDGRFIVSSVWTARSTTFDALLVDDALQAAEYTRSFSIIGPVNTICEAVGFHAAPRP